MKRKVLKKQKKNAGTDVVENNKEVENVGEATNEGTTKQDEEVEETFVEKTSEDDERVGEAFMEHKEEENVGEIAAEGTILEDEKVSEEHYREHAKNEEELGRASVEDERAGELIVDGAGLEDEKVSDEHYEEHAEDEGKFGGDSVGGIDNEAEKLVDNFAAAAAAIVEESTEQKTPETKAAKPRLRRLVKGKNVKATPTVQGTDDEINEYVLSGNIEEVDDMELNMTLEINKDDDVGGEASVGGMDGIVKATEVSAEATKSAALPEKNTPKSLKAKGKIANPRAKQVVKTNTAVDILQVKEINNKKGNFFVANAQENGESSQKDTEVSKGQEKEGANEAEKNNQYQLTQENTGHPENANQKSKRRGRRGGLNKSKKFKKELAANEIAEQKEPSEMEKINPNTEKRDNLQDGGKTEKKKEKLGGLIFMCNAKTKPDCLRYHVMGVSENNKNQVLGIRPGLKLFLYDYELKLLYGVFMASSSGGMMLERKAFGGSFPAQVRFKVIVDCNPLPESEFKNAIKENYSSKKKFKTELTPAQVSKLRRLFKRAPVHSTPRFPPRPHLAPASRNANRGRSEKKRYAPSSSNRGIQNHNQDRNHRRVSPLPPRREEPRDLYLSEREYRVHGLKREERSHRHYDIPISDPYARDPERGHRLPRHPEVVYERREAVRTEPLYMPARDLRAYDVGVIREFASPTSVPQNRYASAVGLEPYTREPQNPYRITAGLDSYARDRRPAYRYESLSRSERPESAYLAPAARREDDGLYTRYATADSLADYYQTRGYGVEPRTAGSYGGLSYSYR